MSQLTLSGLNRLDASEFREALGSIYEFSPWVADRVFDHGPFASIEELHQRMVTAVENSSEPWKLALLNAHPELAGREAAAGGLTSTSATEQAGAGLDQLSEDEREKVRELNAAYRERFGYPFIIAVGHQTRESILKKWQERLQNEPKAEKSIALQEVFKIARLRLDNLIDERAA